MGLYRHRLLRSPQGRAVLQGPCWGEDEGRHRAGSGGWREDRLSLLQRTAWHLGHRGPDPVARVPYQTSLPLGHPAPQRCDLSFRVSRLPSPKYHLLERLAQGNGELGFGASVRGPDALPPGDLVQRGCCRWCFASGPSHGACLLGTVTESPSLCLPLRQHRPAFPGPPSAIWSSGTAALYFSFLR